MSPPKRKPYITIYQSIGGWKAVLMWWNDEEPSLGGFWEPYQTGIGAYATPEEAELEGREWAESEELEFVSLRPRKAGEEGKAP